MAVGLFMSFDADIYNRACNAIHHGALTNSKRPEVFVKGIGPTHVVKGNGAVLFDKKGNKYIDYICALGTNLFGYNNPQISQAIVNQLGKGIVYSLSSELEVDCAEKLKGYLHFVGKVRFLKTGTEACMSSLKIARAHTNRNHILSEGYHGHSDPFVSLSLPAIGVPQDFNIKKFTAIEQINESVAAVILEPIVTDYSKDRIEFLIKLRNKCNQTGTLLIFDEIITGLRWRNLTFTNDSGIIPDILLLGKVCGGGLPLSVIATKPGIGEGKEWFVSGTHAGETLSIAAFNEVLKMLHSTHNLNNLWAWGQKFIDSFNSMSDLKIVGYPTRGVFEGDTMFKALFFQETVKSGMLFGPSFFYNFCHKEFDDITLNSCNDIITRIKTGMVKLEGPLPTSPFAQQQRKG